MKFSFKSLSLSAVMLLACCAQSAQAADTLMMATTTSTQDTGLLEYLNPVFKKETGSTIFQYIQAKRLCLAQLALSRGASVTEACEEAGFNDYSNFIRTFRKILGCTPGEYQKQVLKQKR